VAGEAEATSRARQMWLAQLAGQTLVDLARQRLRVRFADLTREGLSVGAEYRWQETQPLALVRLETENPLGLPAILQVEALTGTTTYDVGGGPFQIAASGLDVRLRRALAAETTAEAHVRYRSRRSIRDGVRAEAGSILGFGLGLDHAVVSTPRHTVGASVRTFHAGSAAFRRGAARVGWRAALRPDDGLAVAPSAFAAQAVVGHASRGTPPDELFLAASGGDIALPLRGHHLRHGGVLGGAPIARSVALVNVELRQRIATFRSVQVGVAGFYDGGRFGGTLQETGTRFRQDLGVGLRIGIGRRTLIRADLGRSLRDGKNALTIGVGEAF
jgi:hypothetical protein